MKKIDSEAKIWTLEVVCNGRKEENFLPCGQAWEVAEEDIVVRKEWYWDSEIEIFGFICPDCGTFTQFEKTSLIPEYIKNRCLIKYRMEQEKAAKSRKKVRSILEKIFKRQRAVEN